MTNDYGMMEFFGKIWKDTDAVVRLATKDKALSFNNQLFKWPAEQPKILDFIVGAVAAHKEVFFSPDLYKPEALTDKKATKPYVLGSHVVCLDFDGNAPTSEEWYTQHDLPQPSVTIQSSSADNQHVYWVLDEFITDIPHLENMRKTITYKSQADGSGWDAGQLLRPPYTVNHKYGKGGVSHDVIIEEISNRSYAQDQFPVPHDYRPLVANSINQNELPSVGAILADNTFVPGFTEAFFTAIEDIPARKRSDTLMAVGYYCTESGLSDSETLALVADADTRWGKYVHRTDRFKRLVDIVERARAKYPVGGISIEVSESTTQISPQTCFEIEDLMNTDIMIEFFYDGLLSTTGYGILAGPPGVGKTQIALRLAESVCNGTDFMIWKNERHTPGRVLFVSLEMSIAPLKYFLTQMNIEVPKDRFFVMPKGDVMGLDTKEGRAELVRQVEDKKPNLIIIDSLSKASLRSLSDDENVRFINSFFNSIQRNYNCAVIAIHHSKKVQDSRKKSIGELDDLYGSRFIGSEADFVVSFVPSTGEESPHITCYSTKIRLGEAKRPFHIKREPDLSFVEYITDEEEFGDIMNPNTRGWAPSDETVQESGESGDSTGSGSSGFRF